MLIVLIEFICAVLVLPVGVFDCIRAVPTGMGIRPIAEPNRRESSLVLRTCKTMIHIYRTRKKLAIQGDFTSLSRNFLRRDTAYTQKGESCIPDQMRLFLIGVHKILSNQIPSLVRV